MAALAAPVAAAAGVPHALTRVFSARLESGGRLGRYTLAEVARHNTPEDAWVVVAGHVSAPPPTTAAAPAAATVAGTP